MAQLVKTVNSLAIASCKTVNGLAIASVKTINGLDNTNSIPANLVGWWKLNDASGTTAADSSGNSNTGTLNGNPTWGTGPNSNGDIVMDGTGDWIDVANESNFDFERTNAFSLSVWIKVNSSATGSRAIMGKVQQSGNTPGYCINYDGDNSLVKFVLLQADGAQFLQGASSANSVPVNTWKLVTCTYDGGSTNTGAKVYINGSLDTATSAGGPLVNTILNNTNLLLGGVSTSAATYWGEMDDARVYNIELTSGQVSTIFSDGAQ